MDRLSVPVLEECDKVNGISEEHEGSMTAKELPLSQGAKEEHEGCRTGD